MKAKELNISFSGDTPKYQKIINAIRDAVDAGRIKKGEQLPSVNEISSEYNFSRDTVLVAFYELKALGIISSTPGKGYFLKSDNTQYQQNIFMLFDELNAFKEDLYNAFLEKLGNKGKVDIFFHHFNRKAFDTLIENNQDKYTAYVIMPAKFTHLADTLDKLPQNRIYMLDQISNEVIDKYPSVYQNFPKDVYNALTSGEHLLQKYEKLIMAYPGGKEPVGQLEGFLDYCKSREVPFEVLTNLNTRNIREREVYITPNDRDLLWLVKEARAKKLKPGRDIGIISYNDTPLKEVVEDGITTISTDFRQMGYTIARMVLNNEREQIENPASLVIRGSL